MVMEEIVRLVMVEQGEVVVAEEGLEEFGEIAELLERDAKFMKGVITGLFTKSRAIFKNLFQRRLESLPRFA